MNAQQTPTAPPTQRPAAEHRQEGPLQAKCLKFPKEPGQEISLATATMMEQANAAVKARTPVVQELCSFNQDTVFTKPSRTPLQPHKKVMTAASQLISVPKRA